MTKTAGKCKMTYISDFNESDEGFASRIATSDDKFSASLTPLKRPSKCLRVSSEL